MRSRSSRRLHRNKINRSASLLLITAVAVAISAGLFLLHSPVTSSQPTESGWLDFNADAQFDSAPALGQSPASENSRVIYPYSVVPGGVATPDELRQASVRDQVVREHYAGFDFQHARVIKVRDAKLVYLSYRIGNEIYWTTKRVTLHAGETLVTDGKITARSRCGNQVSALPQKKASPQEPSLAAFDGPIGSSMKIPLPEDFHSALESRSAPPWGVPALGPASPFAIAGGSPPFGGGYLPVGSPIVPGLNVTTAVVEQPKSQGPGLVPPGPLRRQCLSLRHWN